MEKLNIVKKISSKYILREIFSFISYNRTKKLVKYNFKLYERLGMQLEDYSLTYKYTIREVKESLPSNPKEIKIPFKPILIIFLIIMNILLYIGAFMDFQEEYVDDLPSSKYNLNTAFYSFLIPLFVISFLFMACINYDITKCCITFSFIINILSIIAFIFTIVKTTIDINIKPGISKNRLLITIFLLVLFPFLIFLYFLLIYKLKEIVEGYRLVNKFIISEFRGFKVNEFFLDVDFKNKRREEQRKILLTSKFIYTLSQEQIELIRAINEFRGNYHLKPLQYSIFEYLDEYFMIANTNKFLNFKNIIEINENIYLFIYPFNNFRNNFDKDNNISEILKIPFLERILIFESQKNLHILAYDSRQLFRNKINFSDNINTNRRTQRSSDILNINNTRINFIP